MARPSLPALTPMHPRDPHEPHRVASVLELFFDLVFVIAVSTLGSTALHAGEHLPTWQVVATYLVAFEFIWWAWVNFTWFASSFDTDDWLYRVLTFLQMAGVLVLAAGLEPMFASWDCRLAAVGYAIMRLALVPQWMRARATAARTSHLPGEVRERVRRATTIYGLGILGLQILWLAWAFLVPPSVGGMVLMGLLVAAEWAVPVVAERSARTHWHPHHIAERYGLFTLILLGESLLGSATALITALHDGAHRAELGTVFLAAFITAACLWWIYFWPTHHTALDGFAGVVRYGYGHLFLFAAAGALSVGVELTVEVVAHGGPGAAGAAGVAGAALVRCVYVLPVAVFFVSTWLLVGRDRESDFPQGLAALASAVLLACAVLPVPTPYHTILPTLTLVGFVVALVRTQARRA